MDIKLGLAALIPVATLAALVGTRHAERTAAPPTTADPARLAARDTASSRAMLPARSLDCRLRRIINFDPSKNQAPTDFLFAESHAFKIFLPAIAVRTAPPPQSTQPPEPVDPATRIVADPDRLAGDAAPTFNRVVDYWPDRVEMAAPINDVSVNLIIIDQIDQEHSSANVFMTKANDAVTYDLKHLYAGKCVVSLGNRGLG